MSDHVWIVEEWDGSAYRVINAFETRKRAYESRDYLKSQFRGSWLRVRKYVATGGAV